MLSLDRGGDEFQAVHLTSVMLGLLFYSASAICMYVILELRRINIFAQ